jgi:hypothetical protein
VIEIASPSTRSRDETIKRRLYERSEVDREADLILAILNAEVRGKDEGVIGKAAICAPPRCAGLAGRRPTEAVPPESVTISLIRPLDQGDSEANAKPPAGLKAADGYVEILVEQEFV